MILLWSTAQYPYQNQNIEDVVNQQVALGLRGYSPIPSHWEHWGWLYTDIMFILNARRAKVVVVSTQVSSYSFCNPYMGKDLSLFEVCLYIISLVDHMVMEG